MNFLQHMVGLDSPELAPKPTSFLARQVRARLATIAVSAYHEALRSYAEICRECGAAEGVDDERDALHDVAAMALATAEAHLVSAILAGHPDLPYGVDARHIPRYCLSSRGVVVHGTLYLAAMDPNADAMAPGDSTGGLHVMRLVSIALVDVVDSFMEGVGE